MFIFMNNYLAKNIAYLIKARHLRQLNMADAIGRKQNTLSNWMNGVSEPPVTDLINIYQYFKIPLEDLLFKDLEKAGMAESPGLGNQESKRKQMSIPTSLKESYTHDVQEQIIEAKEKIIRLLETTQKMHEEKIQRLEKENKALHQEVEMLSKTKKATSKMI